jgi:ubiquinone/menaquinone biosynthesis C-methylase UbiE
MNKDELVALYNQQANGYARLSKKKKTIDYNWRLELLAFAKGKILEVSVGAGANFRFYPKNAEVTAVDMSSAMIDKAKEIALVSGLNVNFINSAIEELDFKPGGFDTIVSTFSLCTYNDPVSVLNSFGRWCKDDGFILLLEHGISKYDLVQWIQDKLDNYQYRRIGCHANRDIMDIIKRSGLRIKMYERKLLGAIYLVWAKPSPHE